MAKENYNKYKNSTVSWLGKIPDHWEIRRIKYVFQELDQRSETGKEDLLSVSQYTGITKKSDKVAEGENISNAKTLEGYKIVEKGNLVINIMLAWNGSLGISKYNGIVSPAYCVYKNLIGDERYFGYLFKTKNAKQEFKKQSTGIIDSRLRMYTDSFFNIKTVLPPKQEQTTIANFLDYKTEKINRFITKKKQLIELLNEQKAAIINQAVTKGINPNVPMKDSGIEWLGEIPEHWKTTKLIGVSNFVRGNSSFKKDELLSNGNYVALQYGKTYKIDEVDKNFQFYVNDEFYKDSQVVNKGDVIIVSTSETIEDLGHSAFYNRTDIGLLGGEQMLLKPNKKIDGKYLYYSSKVFTKELRKYSTGVKVFRFNINDLKTIYTSIPPIEEQIKISEYIQSELNTVTKTITTIEKEITLVEEYKTALIAEAVTGKIDVRDFKLPTEETPLTMVAEEASNYKKEVN
ncbi:restriction endonuclease subunit S [Olleya marilimosa]|uniref:restriction endonuclease subunit S n=1 Tax=Olleya marilimosa TaxID=272164 RepID=UPI000484FB6C|nr:restriction endonuclease subunit S [Olleya marilimosa]